MLELFRILASSSLGGGDASEVEGSDASIKFLRVPPLDTAWPRGSEHRLGVGGSSGKAVAVKELGSRFAAGRSSDGVPRGASVVAEELLASICILLVHITWQAKSSYHGASLASEDIGGAVERGAARKRVTLA